MVLKREQVLQFAACFSCSLAALSSQQVIGELAPASHSGVNYEEGTVGGNMLCSAQPGGLWCVQGSFCDLEGKWW